MKDGSSLKVPDKFNIISLHIPLSPLRFVFFIFSKTTSTSSDDWSSLEESESSEESDESMDASRLSAMAVCVDRSSRNVLTADFWLWRAFRVSVEIAARVKALGPSECRFGQFLLIVYESWKTIAHCK